MITKLRIFIVTVLIGFCSTLVYYALVDKAQSDLGSTPTPTPKIEAYDLEKAPPSSLKGKITQMIGDVGWQSRVATEPASITEPIPIQQGEKLVTGKDSKAIIQFQGDTTIQISAESGVNLTQTLPANIVVTQENGTVIYAQNESTIPLSVRARHLLIRLHEGSISVQLAEKTNEDDEITDSAITVNMLKGSATTAYNDLDYQTHTLNLVAGNTLLFDEIRRKSSIR